MIHQCVGALALLAVPTLSSASVTISAAVRTGQLMPTGAGQIPLRGFIGDSGNPAGVINDSGVVTFGGGVRFNVEPVTNGLWMVDSGVVTAVAVANEPAPGAGGFLYRNASFTFAPTVGGGAPGVVPFFAFKAGVVGPGIPGDATGSWSTSGPSTTGLAVYGQPASSPVLTYAGNAVPHATRAGFVNVLASYAGPGVTPDNADALVQFSGSLSRQIARQGDAAPGTPGTYSTFTAIPSASAAGRSAFIATISGPGVSSANSLGAWVEGPGGPELVYRRAVTPAPGLVGGTVLSSGVPQFSATAQFGALRGSMQGPTINAGNNEGLWMWNGTFTQALREGEALRPSMPNSRRMGGATFGGSDFTRVNDGGDVATLLTTIDANNQSYTSLVRGTLAGFDVICDLGQQAPGLPVGTTVQGIAYPLAMNETGQIAMSVELSGVGVVSTNNRAIYFVGQSGLLDLVARKGDALQFDSGQSIVTRLSGDFGFDSLGTSALNNSGQLLFTASTADGESGVYVASVPAPGMLGFLAVAYVCVLRRSRANLE